MKIGECEECGDWPIYVDDGGLCSECREEISDKMARTQHSRHDWENTLGKVSLRDRTKEKRL